MLIKKQSVMLVGLMTLFSLLVSADDQSSGTEVRLPVPEGDIASLMDKPNILIVVADDLGYTDLGSFGGDIETPNIDILAEEGTRFSQFHVAAACSPTRAMMLTSVDSHLVGLGSFDRAAIANNQKGVPGYEAYLNKRAASMGEIFVDNGYHTYVTGKWHLGYDANSTPPVHGFQRSFIQVDGGAGHFNELPAAPLQRRATYRDDGKLTNLPEDFYSSDFYVDQMIRYLDQDKDSGRPFLAYLSFTAPHWPLQAKEATIEKYNERYRDGFDALLDRRLEGLINLGLLSDKVRPQAYENDEIRSWSSLTEEEKQFEAKRMAVYAAMIDDMDVAFGRLIQHLKDIGKFENTSILFLSDNGAEGHKMKGFASLVELSTLFGIPCCDNSIENLGAGDSFIELGPEWAQASVGPYRIYKGFPTQGGILSPAIFKLPKSIDPQWFTEFVSVKDVLPTLLALAGIEDHGEEYAGRKVFPIEGKSMLPMLRGESSTVHGHEVEMGWQLFTKHAIRVGDWKLLRLPEPYGDNQWQLYHMPSDPLEANNLAAEEPARLDAMISHWRVYQERANVIIPDGPWYLTY